MSSLAQPFGRVLLLAATALAVAPITSFDTAPVAISQSECQTEEEEDVTSYFAGLKHVLFLMAYHPVSPRCTVAKRHSYPQRLHGTGSSNMRLCMFPEGLSDFSLPQGYRATARFKSGLS